MKKNIEKEIFFFNITLWYKDFKDFKERKINCITQQSFFGKKKKIGQYFKVRKNIKIKKVHYVCVYNLMTHLGYFQIKSLKKNQNEIVGNKSF